MCSNVGAKWVSFEVSLIDHFSKYQTNTGQKYAGWSKNRMILGKLWHFYFQKRHKEIQ